MKMVDFALWYASHGLLVFPLDGKKPFPGSHGLKDATTDSEQINSWWNQHPYANIGLPTGKETGIVVIDVDQKPKEGKFGKESLKKLESEYGALPDTWKVETGTGGEHYYFSYPSGYEIRNSASKLEKNIDIRAEGGYIVAPPSIHPDTQKAYRWIRSPDKCQLAELPTKWIEVLTKGSQKPQDGEFIPPDAVSKGLRNDTLFKYAASLRAKKEKPARILELMVAYNNDHCKPPLPDKEIIATYDSVLKYPEGTSYKEILGSRKVAVQKVSEIQKKEMQWLIPGYIPAGCVTLLGADGGAGKTATWCNLAAAISTGHSSLLEEKNSPKPHRSPQNVLFFSGEDSVAVILRNRLELAGADSDRIYCVDLSNPDFNKITFNSPALKTLILQIRPALCVFDPLQSFVPESVNMSSRNAMRHVIEPLLEFGGKTGTAFLIIMHTNKRMFAYGRDRFADSADMWDIARSALMVGMTKEKGIRYISQEKSNYGALQETVLFTIDGEGKPVFQGTTDKRDREFQSEKASTGQRHTAVDDASQAALDLLDDGQAVPIKDFEEELKDNGYSSATVRRAKDRLKKEDKIFYFSKGSPKEKIWYIQRK